MEQMIYIISSLLLCLCARLSTTSEPSKAGEYFSKDQLFHPHVTSTLVEEFTSARGYKVYVFDELITAAHAALALHYFTVNNHWRYTLFDQHLQVDDIVRRLFANGNSVPWKSWQDPTAVAHTRLGLILRNAVNALDARSTGQRAPNRTFELTQIYSAISRRGDVPSLHADSRPADPESYSALTFLSLLWRKNSYGQLLFYQDDDDGEIFATIEPRFGRTVVWEGRARYLLRPPSIHELSGQHLLFSRFHSDPDTILSARTFYHKYFEDQDKATTATFARSADTAASNTDLKNHVFLQKTNRRGDHLTVFDGLFSKPELDALRSHTIKYGKYFYDELIDRTSDNVQWIASLPVKKFVDSSIWPVIRRTAQFVSGRDSWYPYDVACNLIRNHDQTRMHLDTSRDGERELTFLLYLSPNWTADDYGETAFMESTADHARNEYVAEVVPKYGRAVIFNGDFPHSARPPAPGHFGPRYTLAVKVYPTKWEAIAQSFREETRHDHHARSSEMLAHLASDPAKFVANIKLMALSSFFYTRRVLHELSHQYLLQRNARNDRGDRDETSEDDPGEEDEASELGMQQLRAMAEYHGLEEEFVDPESDEQEGNGDFDRIFERNKRVCAGSAECLDQYLQLHLVQLKMRNTNAQRQAHAFL